jgi:spore maturation protein CgeB
MKLVIFGLTISSSWGNGHATLWRALCRSLARRGHSVVFFERDVPYYAAHRDLTEIPDGQLYLYSVWKDALPHAKQHLAEADVAVITSYCPDAIRASDLVLSSRAALRVFYDLDTPVTLELLESGQAVPYIPQKGLGDFDLVLSYTGGAAITQLKKRLGARLVAPLYGCVDPEIHYPVPAVRHYRADISYLGTYAADRQEALETLFIEPARRLPTRRFLIGGAQYPQDFPWVENIYFVNHVPPPHHSAFYCSSALTLNVTRRPMARLGYCPSGRLFEAAACGVAILTDGWEGLDQFFEPHTQILVADSTDPAIGAIEMPRGELEKIARVARERTLDEHTAYRRAIELEQAVERARHESAQVQPRTVSIIQSEEFLTEA